MRARLGLVVVAAAALAAAWGLSPAGSPPVYDGLCLSSPYRYLHPPAGVTAPAPDPVTRRLPVAGGDIQTTEITTDEPNQPQAQLIIASGTLRIPAGATEVQISITPVEPPSAAPADGAIDGNIYDFAATSDAGPVTPTGSTKATILLIGTSTTSAREVLEHFDGRSWRQVPTVTIGCAGSYATSTTEFGDYAVVALGAQPSAPSPSPPAATGAPAWFLPTGIGLLVAAGIAGTIRIRQRR